MKKFVFHLRQDTPVVLTHGSHSVTLKLHEIDVSESEAFWDVNVTEAGHVRTISSEHGKHEKLTRKWPGSYLALCTPIKFYVDKGKNYPEFVVLVPDDTEIRFDKPKV